MDMNNENWEIPAPLPDMEAELKKIRKDIRRRNWKIVLTSLVLVAALLVGTVQFAIPALEKTYWDPAKSRYSPSSTDLELTLYAYSELFNPYMLTADVRPFKTGFATYSLSIKNSAPGSSTDIQYFTAELSKNALSLPTGFCSYAPVSFFSTKSIYSSDEILTGARKRLKQLPDYVRVQAFVSFAEDQNLGAVTALDEELFTADPIYASNINWITIRGCDENDTLTPQCGMRPFYNYMSNTDINESYPCYSMNGIIQNNKNLSQHFKSLLQFSIDRLEEGTGIVPLSEMDESAVNAYADYYQNVLDYVEENGVYACGCYLTASPQALLKLLDSGLISGIRLEDAQFGF